MKTLCIYLFITAVAINVAGNWAANTAEGIREAREARTERLCQINKLYC